MMPVVECLLAPVRRPRIRAARLQMEDLERERKATLAELEQYVEKRDSLGMLDAVDRVLERHGLHDERARNQEFREQIRQMHEESEALQQIRSQTGEDWVAAAREYRAYLEAHPESTLARSYLAGALRKQGDLAGSLATYREEVDLAGASTVSGITSRLLIGQLLREQGHAAEAVTELRQLLEDPAVEHCMLLPAVYLEYGHALHASDDPTGARAAWKQVIRRDRTGIAAKHARELLAEPTSR